MKEHLLELVEHLQFGAELSQAGGLCEVALSQNGIHESVMGFGQEVDLDSHHKLEEALNGVVGGVSRSKSCL